MAKRVNVDINVNSNSAVGSVTKFTSSIGKMESDITKSTQKMTSGFSGLSKAVVGLASVTGIVAFGNNIKDTGLKFDSLNRSYKAITGSTEEAGKQMKFVSDLATTLGFNILKLSDDYKTLTASAKNTSLEGEGVQDLFQSIIETGAVLGTSDDAMSRAFNQFTQAIGRGKFELEDLKTISENLAGVGMQDFADAIGVTVTELHKMSSQGKVLTDEVVPGLVEVLKNKFGKEAVEAAMSARAEFGRFGNNIDMLKGMIGEQLLPVLASVAKSTNEWVTANKEVIKSGIKEYGISIKENLEKLIPVLIFVKDHFKGISIAVGVLIGYNVVSWLGSITTGAVVFTATALKAAAAINVLSTSMLSLNVAMGLIGAAFLGWKLGEWINSFEIVQKTVQKTFAYIDFSIQNFLLSVTQTKNVLRDLSNFNIPTLDFTQGRDKLKKDLEITLQVIDDSFKDKPVKIPMIMDPKDTSQIKTKVDETNKVVAKNIELTKEQQRALDLSRETIAKVADEYNKLTLSAVEYGKLELKTWFDEEAKAIGRITPELQKLYDLKLRLLEVNDAMSKNYDKSMSKFYDEMDATAKTREAEEILKNYEKDQERKNQKTPESEIVRWAKSVKTTEEMLTSMAIKGSEAIADHLVDSLNKWIDGTMKAGEAFRSFAASFLKEIAKMIAQQTILNGLKSIMGGSSGIGIADGIGSIFGGDFDPFGLIQFAKGSKNLPGGFKAFASGSSKISTPTLGLVGEGRYNEAIVPLPDGNNIPVKLQGGSGGGATLNIVNNINMSGGNNGDNKNLANQTASIITSKIKEVIANEKRYGGLLWQN